MGQSVFRLPVEVVDQSRLLSKSAVTQASLHQRKLCAMSLSRTAAVKRVLDAKKYNGMLG